MTLAEWDRAQAEAAANSSNEIHAQVSAMMGAEDRKSPRKVPVAPVGDDSELSKSVHKEAQAIDIELQDRINAICSAHKQKKEQCVQDRLQDRINTIVGAHADSLKEQRLLCASPSPSPSPARSMSASEFEFYA